ncbi:MAG TPA: DUF6600 domain-containing protein, partial [Devosiaceae bacterium]|nr:DUF6600 domain-containing protein [Devosiaceae bacterium]
MMFKTRLIGTAMAAALLLAPPAIGVAGFVAPAHAQQAQVSFNIFFDRLSQGGVWVKSSRYDYVWCPRVEARWAPYTHGHWVYLSDRGWYFDSDEPFAWAVYHYGRWYRDRDIGWCWVPGNVWAPAWVTWRRSNDYVGWAPLPPHGSGFAVGVTVAKTDVPRDEWVFVPTRHFLEPRLSTTIVFGSQQPDVYRRTRDVGAVVVQNNIVVNNVINVNFIEQQTNQKVEPVKVETTNQPPTTTQVQNQTIQVFDAKLPPPSKDAAPQQAVQPTEAKQKLATMTPATPSDQGNAPAAGAAAGGQGQAGAAANGTAGGANGTGVGENAGAGANAGGTAGAGGNSTQSQPGGANAATPGTAGAAAGAATSQGTNAKSGGNGASATCPAGEEMSRGKCRPAKNNGPANTSTTNGGKGTSGATGA